MNDFDENGWAPIHHAAFRGFVKSVDRFVKSQEDQLELRTNDGVQCSPLLLAVRSGQKETVQCLLDLGADILALTTQNHGVVEIACLKQFVHLIEYFIELAKPELPVWKLMLKLFASTSEEEAEAAGYTVKRLTNPTNDAISANWKVFFDTGGIPVCIGVVKEQVGEDATVQALQIILNVIERDEVKEQIASCGGVQVLIKVIKQGGNEYHTQLAANILKEMCKLKKYADISAQHNALPAMGEALKRTNDPDVLLEVVDAMGFIAEAGHQQAAVALPGIVSRIVNLYEDRQHPRLLHSLTTTVTQFVRNYQMSQDRFIEEGISAHVIVLMKVSKRYIQMAAIECIQALAENNPVTQNRLLEDQAVRPLVEILKRTRQDDLLETTAHAIWSLAGEEFDRRRYMAMMVGVTDLIGFLNSKSKRLHAIGSEALSALAQGPHNKQEEIGHSNGIHPLVHLIDTSDDESIHLSVIRTLRHLCVAVGFVPCKRNQALLTGSRGLKYLTALMVQAEDELVQVEAAVTLGYACLGNPDQMIELRKVKEFDYVRILKMLYSQREDVKLLAGSALTAFAYNSLKEQKQIAVNRALRFGCWFSFLQSSNEFFRCNAAFQIVVLARIIPDEEQAESSAAGIKLLVDLLQDSRSNDILALAADCLARLAHTRAGVPGAIVAIGGVEQLCKLLISRNEFVRGCAAIALSYLSYNHKACRKLLGQCRQDPFMIKALSYYCKDNYRISPEFWESWEHSKRIHLPVIPQGRLSLIGSMPGFMELETNGRPMTILSIHGSTPVNGPASSLGDPVLGGLPDITRRSSGQSESPLTRSEGQLGSKQNSLLSGARSRTNSIHSHASFSRKSTDINNNNDGLLQEA